MNTFQPSGPQHHTHSSQAYGTLAYLNPQYLGQVPNNNQTGVLVTAPRQSKYGSLGPLVSVAGLVGSGVAAAISYKRNQSVLWALGSFLIWPVALPYFYITKED